MLLRAPCSKELRSYPRHESNLPTAVLPSTRGTIGSAFFHSRKCAFLPRCFLLEEVLYSGATREYGPGHFRFKLFWNIPSPLEFESWRGITYLLNSFLECDQNVYCCGEIFDLAVARFLAVNRFMSEQGNCDKRSRWVEQMTHPMLESSKLAAFLLSS